MSDMLTQHAREQAMAERGQHRAETAYRAALERGQAGETPAGIELARRAVQPLSDAIRAFCDPATKKGAGRRHTAAKLLQGIDPDLIAFCAVKVTLGYAAGARSLHTTAMKITEVLEDELIADGFDKANGALFRAVLRNARARGLAPQRQAKAVAMANRQFNLVQKPWTRRERALVGVKLVEMMIETIGIFRSDLTRTGRREQTHRLHLTPEIEAWMQQYNGAAALMRPMLLPTVVPPLPWKSCRLGGYHTPHATNRFSLITKAFPGQRQAVEAAILDGTMAPHLKGLNGLQATPWRIHKRVLEVMREAWDKGLAVPLPQRDPEAKPEAPPEVVNDVKGGEHRRAWRRRMRDWYAREQSSKSARFEFARALAIAEEHAEYPAIYFPHRLDFRGRAYAAGTSLHPQGPDECRALIEFAEGKAVGERGLFWLGVAGANVWGNDRVSLEERYAWAMDRGEQAQQWRRTL